MINFYDKFGPRYSSPMGYIVEPVNHSEYKHKFGGSSWSIVDGHPIADGPSLLFVLDLSDPKFKDLTGSLLKELPICSYINSDVWLNEQVYKINNDTSEVFLLSKNSTGINTLSDEDKMPNPLPEISIGLREMMDSEYPIDEDSYWLNTSDFLGGRSFIRVLGNPLWLEDVKKIGCSCCGLEMNYIMSLGYEGWDGPFQYIENMPFFLGESALYIYFCVSCSELKVISQSS